MAAMCFVRGFVALAVVALISYVTCQEFDDGGLSRGLNDRCNNDGDCRMRNSYCHNTDHRCMCREGFTINRDNSDCIATIGTNCRTNGDCASLPNSQCMSGVCVCNYNYVPHPEEQRCLERRGLGDHCDVGEQCHTKFNFNAHCINEVCVCRENHHETANRTCIQSKSLAQSCVIDEECYLGEIYKDRTRCVQNACACKHEFPQTEDGKCGSGAPGTQVWSSVMTLAVMASVAKIITM